MLNKHSRCSRSSAEDRGMIFPAPAGCTVADTSQDGIALHHTTASRERYLGDYEEPTQLPTSLGVHHTCITSLA